MTALCTLFLCLSMSVSAYSDTGITASGAWTRSGYAACGPSFPFGTAMVVKGRAYLCADRGGLVTDRHLDLFTYDEEAALSFGRQELPVVVIRQEAAMDETVERQVESAHTEPVKAALRLMLPDMAHMAGKTVERVVEGAPMFIEFTDGTWIAIESNYSAFADGDGLRKKPRVAAYLGNWLRDEGFGAHSLASFGLITTAEALAEAMIQEQLDEEKREADRRAYDLAQLARLRAKYGG